MKGYYLNLTRQTTGEFELHAEDCETPPYARYMFLGEYNSCEEAMAEAKTIIEELKSLESLNQSLDGCRTCCEDCHTK